MSVRTLLITAVAVTAAVANVCPAQARSPSNQVTVSHADLNLDSAAGRATLDRRVAGAVRQLCGRFAPVQTGLADTSRDCAEAAYSSAAAQRDAIGARRVPSVSVSTTAY